MSNFDWAYPNTVWFGVGRIKDLPKACKKAKNKLTDNIFFI